MRPHRELDVWKVALDFVEEIYELTSDFPTEEKYGLISQLRRATISVPTNIAEGAGRQTDKEFLNFLYIASGSMSEIETLVEIATRLDYLDIEPRQQLDEKIQRISAMINGLIKKLKEDNNS